MRLVFVRGGVGPAASPRRHTPPTHNGKRRKGRNSFQWHNLHLQLRWVNKGCRTRLACRSRLGRPKAAPQPLANCRGPRPQCSLLSADSGRYSRRNRRSFGPPCWDRELYSPHKSFREAAIPDVSCRKRLQHLARIDYSSCLRPFCPRFPSVRLFAVSWSFLGPARRTVSP